MIQRIKHYLFYPRFHFNRFQFNLVALFFLTVGFIAGSYLTLSKIFPHVFALNDTHKTWNLNASTTGDYTKSLVTIEGTEQSPIGAHPTGGQVGANKFTNPGFATGSEGGAADNWSVAAVPPSGWVEIAGNATLGTTNFLAMQYEAKYDNDGNGDGDNAGTGTPPTGCRVSASYDTIDWGNTSSPCPSSWTGTKLISTANGSPIAGVSHNEAVTACSQLTLNSQATHLIRNPEWMTIARDAENVGANWTSGSVGSGCMFRGNSGETTCGYNGADPDKGTSRNARAKFTLSNNSQIYDISGNVWEYVNFDADGDGTYDEGAVDKVSRDQQPEATTNGTDPITDSAYTWSEFYGTGATRRLLNNGAEPPFSDNVFRPFHSTYNSTQGVGQVHHWSNSTTSSIQDRVFLRGASWGNTSEAGAFTLYLDWSVADAGGAIGFRCASDPVAISQSFSSSSGRAGGGDTITIGSISDGKIYQSVNVGDTSTYDFSAYVKCVTGCTDNVVDNNIAALYYGGNTISNPNYTSVGSNWYKLTGTITGVASAVDTGVLVKAGKSVIVDDLTLSKSGEYSVYTTSAYSNAQLNSWDTFCEGTLTGSDCTVDATHTGDASIRYQVCLDDGSGCSYTSGSRWKYYTGGTWQNATDYTSSYSNLASELTQTAMQALGVPPPSQKISIKAIFAFGGADVPYLPHLSLGLTTDTTPPDTNASAVVMTRSNGGTSVSSNGWIKNDSPYFSWTAGADNSGGSGIKGYCLYLGTDPDGNPATAKGLLGTSPVSTAGTTCQFIVSATSIDFATSSYKGGTWLSTSSSPYYLNIKVVDNSGNVYTGSSTQFQFRYDATVPTNTSYISCASGSFSNVADMNFSWPTTGAVASSDSNAGLLGWQYQINSTSGTWLGTTTESTLGVNNYIPTTESSRTLTEAQDGSAIVSGNNIVYFRTVDAAGNTSSDGTIRTCNLSYGGAAPAFGATDTVTVTPSTSTSNSFALSWPAATPANGQTVAHYYYMVNTSPPSTLATLQGNATTYIDNGTSRTVSATALANVNKGSNTVYVVAIDDASTPNYSPSNYITGTFTLNSTDPDNVGNLVASDSSIKSQSQWNVTLTWTVPTYQGAGNLTYRVYRSTDGTSFSLVGTTSGLSYVDNTPSSALYYYKVYTRDGAAADSSGTNAVSITPTGKWTSAPSLESGPTVGSITTKKATITWSTSRTSDSKVQYGTTSGSYNTVEPSNSSQVTSHSIQLTGLNPGTTYYYKAKWTDEDGNTGTSDEKSFATASAPTVKDVSAKNIGLTSAIIQFTSKDASKVKIYYGKTTSFGGVKETSTSTSETTYTSELIGLDDGTKYYYKINTFDSESSEYEGTILDFTTLPRPKISNVRIQQVANTAQPTVLVTWTTNTDISSIVTYYPQGNLSDARDEVNVALTKGAHRMIVRGLVPQTDYILVVKGRDKIGNEATSDPQRFTTATDTRPPQISELHVEGAAIPPTTTTAQESTAQLIVSWNTDEPGTSQVEFGEGTGTTYSSKTQEDSNLTFNHFVIISGLTPSKVYHLRAISKDKAGNIGNSIDTVKITPKATENALNLVITNLQEAFGFIGGLKK